MQYMNARRSTNPPHIFAVADASFQQMLFYQQPQVNYRILQVPCSLTVRAPSTPCIKPNMLCIYTADADAIQLSSRVASRRRQRCVLNSQSQLAHDDCK